MDLVPDLVPDQMPNLPLERLPDLVPCLVHTRYQMVLGAVAASERTASKGAGGMGEAFRLIVTNGNSESDFLKLIVQTIFPVQNAF